MPGSKLTVEHLDDIKDFLSNCPLIENLTVKVDHSSQVAYLSPVLSLFKRLKEVYLEHWFSTLVYRGMVDPTDSYLRILIRSLRKLPWLMKAQWTGPKLGQRRDQWMKVFPRLMLTQK